MAKKKAVNRRPAKRRKVAKRRKAAPRKRRTVARTRTPARKVVKQVERRSTERVLAGKRPKRRKARKRKVMMAGRSRRRSVGGMGGGMKLLIGVAAGAGLLYLLSKKKSGTTTAAQLPAVTQTQNYNRNMQANNLLQYAMAGGMAIDAIIRLIDKLNTSSDQEVENIYDTYNATGNLYGVYV